MTEKFISKLFDSKHFRNLEQMVFALYVEDAEGEAMSSEKIQRTVNRFRQSPEKGRIELLFIDERIIGYAILVYLWSNEYGGDFLIVDEIYIKPDWRGQGIGSRFIGRLETEESSAVGLQLEVTKENTRARELYQLLGFKRDGNHHMFKVFP